MTTKYNSLHVLFISFLIISLDIHNVSCRRPGQKSGGRPSKFKGRAFQETTTLTPNESPEDDGETTLKPKIMGRAFSSSGEDTETTTKRKVESTSDSSENDSSSSNETTSSDSSSESGSEDSSSSSEETTTKHSKRKSKSRTTTESSFHKLLEEIFKV